MKPSKAKKTGQNEEIRAINNVKKLQDMCIELSSTRNQLESTARTLKSLYRKEQAKYDKAKCELSNIKAKMPLIDFYRDQLLNYSKDINTIMKTQTKTNMSIEEYKAAINRKNKKVSEIFQQQEMFLQSMSRIQSFDDGMPTTEYAKHIENEINILKASGKFKSSNPDVIKTLQEEKGDFEKQYKECKAQLDLVTKENTLLRQLNERNATQKLEKQLKQQQELNSKLLDENSKLRQQKTDLQQQLSDTLSKLLKLTSPPSKSNSGVKQGSRKSEDNKSMASVSSIKSQASTVSKSGKKMILRPKNDFKSPRTPKQTSHIHSPEKDDKATIADLKKQLSAANAKISELKAEQQNHNSTIEQENRSKELRSTFASKREEYNRELEIRSQDKAKMVERISQFETQIKEIGQEINRLRQANADGKQRIATIEKKIEEGTAKIQTKKSRWEKQNAEQEEIIAKKEAELARINEQLSPIQKPAAPQKPQKSVGKQPSLVDFKDSDCDENGDDFKEMQTQGKLVMSPTKTKSKPLPDMDLSSTSDDFSDLKPQISMKPVPMKLESPKQNNNKPTLSLPDSDPSDDFSDLKPSKPPNRVQLLPLNDSSSDDFSDLKPVQKASPAVLKLNNNHDSLASFAEDGTDGDFSDMEVVTPSNAQTQQKSFIEGDNEFADLPTSHSTTTLQLPSSAFDADDGGFEMTDSRPPSLKRRPPSLPISDSGSMEFERPKPQKKPSILSIPDARMMSARSDEFADSETPVRTGSSRGELRDFEDSDCDSDSAVIGYRPPEKPEQPALLKLADTTPDIGTIFDDDDSGSAPLTLRPQRGQTLTMTQPLKRRDSQADSFSNSGPVTPKARKLDPDVFADLDDDDDVFGKPIEEPRTADGHILIRFDDASWFDFQKMERHLARHNAIMNGVGLPEPMTPRDNESIASIINDIPDSKLF